MLVDLRVLLGLPVLGALVVLLAPGRWGARTAPSSARSGRPERWRWWCRLWCRRRCPG